MIHRDPLGALVTVVTDSELPDHGSTGRCCKVETLTRRTVRHTDGFVADDAGVDDAGGSTDRGSGIEVISGDSR